MVMNLKSISLLISLVFALQTAAAQDWFSDHERNTNQTGYIIGIAGDTITGQIQYDYPVIMQKRVTFFQSSVLQDPKIYQPGDIRGYGLSDKRWISTKVIMDTYDGPFQFNRFGLVESNPGPVALLRIFEEKDKHKKKLNSEEAEILYRNIPYNREPGSYDHLYIKKNEDPAISVFTREFKKTFTSQILHYIGDHQDLKDKIENGSWSWKDLDKIVNEYNRWYLSKYSKIRE
jgi:hypothetical protein